jgi:cytosine/adenosine deaminase-related metal-dependent hydrolase
MTDEWSVTARWLFPVDRPPIPDGILTLQGERIAAVEPRGARKADLDLGNVAILPGLVNAHTHLDLGALRGELPPPDDFTQWLRAVVNYRRNSSVAEWQQAIQAGIEESIAAGTTLVGDISSGGLSREVLAHSPLRSVIFYELLGLRRPRARQAAAELKVWLHQGSPEPRCRLALSPHAPYSVRRSLFRLSAKWATRSALPVAIHLAESTAESELLRDHRGPLRDFLEEVEAWDESGLVANLAEIMNPLELHSLVLYIHANYLPPSLWQLYSNTSIVFCPRTHAYFRHERHPFREMMEFGAKVCLGTDSLASNPDLSILEEMRFVWRGTAGGIAGPDLLAMGTLNGARGLGWQTEVGSLTSGKSADWITIPLPNAEPGDPHDLLFDSCERVRDVVTSGRWLIRAGTPQH